MIKKHIHAIFTAKNFFHHFIRNLILGFVILMIILLIGMLGYRYIEKLDWLGCYSNAAMIISGVGTLNDPETKKGEFFVATYSLIGGASFILTIAIVFAPIFHWLFRKAKVEDREHFTH